MELRAVYGAALIQVAGLGSSWGRRKNGLRFRGFRLKTRFSLLENRDAGAVAVPNLRRRCTSQETTLSEAHEVQTSSVAP